MKCDQCGEDILKADRYCRFCGMPNQRNNPAPVFSLDRFLKDLIGNTSGYNISWDFKLHVPDGKFFIFIPIKFYCPESQHVALRAQLENVAEIHGLTVADTKFQTLGDNMILQAKFADLRAIGRIEP